MNHALNEPTDTGYQRPRDPVEIWLARQWQHILGFAVGIRENFFGVGGNSLDAARVTTAVQRAHECDTEGRLAAALRELIG